MNRRNYYFGKDIYWLEMDDLQNNIESSINEVKKAIGSGILKGGNFTINGMILTIEETVLFDLDGNDMNISVQEFNLAGYEPETLNKIVSICGKFKRDYSQEETDEFGLPQHFKEDEGHDIVYMESTIATNPVAPDIAVDMILIADITLTAGMETIQSTDISYSRVKKVSGGLLNYVTEKFANHDSEHDDRFLRKDLNFSDLGNIATARATLSVYSKSETYTKTEVNSAIANNNIIAYRNSAGVESTCVIKRIVAEIGDWNMDTTDYVLVNIGLDISEINIISVNVKIRGDAGLYIDDLPLNYWDDAMEMFAGGFSFGNAFSDKIYLSRKQQGKFDSTNYNATSYNRGWIYIEYI